jgi:hypothetical protein
MKRWVKIAWIVILPVLALICWYGWDSRKNHGLSFGYYGQFNNVSNALAGLSGVQIESSWYNQDLSLEGFSFDIEWQGRPITIMFAQGDPIREMSAAKLDKALLDLIKKAPTAQRTK